MAPATLPKEERISSRTAISTLMENGRWGVLQPIRFCYLKGNGTDINRIMVSVPKKFFHRAVKRNLLKRRIREAYRTQKDLLEASGVDILFIYSTQDILESRMIHDMVGTILKEITRKVSAQ